MFKNNYTDYPNREYNTIIEVIDSLHIEVAESEGDGYLCYSDAISIENAKIFIKKYEYLPVFNACDHLNDHGVLLNYRDINNRYDCDIIIVKENIKLIIFEGGDLIYYGLFNEELFLKYTK
jgi:hypothetical protein